MLINALCNYYDILSHAGKVLQDGYSKVNVHYLICLKETGEIDTIIQYQNKEEVKMKNGKIKEIWHPKEVIMPERTEKPGIDSNVIEHRPVYLFGLVQSGDILSPTDKTGKAEKSHNAFVTANLEFLEGLDSPVINAYRNFILNWKPEEETENIYLKELGKNYSKSNFVFCLSGYPEKLLHEDSCIKEKWNHLKTKSTEENPYIAQCAVSGEVRPVARIHNKIKGIYGGLAVGSVLISYKNSSENSYCNESSYNSNISELAMKKYTEALNYLLNSSVHKVLLEDITILFWAMDEKENYEDAFNAMLFGKSDTMSAESVDKMFEKLMKDAKNGKVIEDRLLPLDEISPNTDFYMAGFKPNSSRISLKFIYRKKYADVLWNIAKHQNDMQIVGRKYNTVSMAQIQKELVSPKSSDKNKTANPALIAKILESILNGTKYPDSLLETTIRRIKIDAEYRLNGVRAGIIKACINRLSNKKEELKVALDKDNKNQAYLCGRLFAVLEEVQLDASGNNLNRTIRDAYFASASSRPASVFPKLIKLAQNHLSTLKNDKEKRHRNYNKLIQEIIANIEGGFPEILMLAEQGKFMVGYYQQYQSFFESSKKEDKKMEEKENGN